MPEMNSVNSPKEQDYFAHESAYIDVGASIGNGTKIWQIIQT